MASSLKEQISQTSRLYIYDPDQCPTQTSVFSFPKRHTELKKSVHLKKWLWYGTINPLPSIAVFILTTPAKIITHKKKLSTAKGLNPLIQAATSIENTTGGCMHTRVKATGKTQKYRTDLSTNPDIIMDDSAKNKIKWSTD